MSAGPCLALSGSAGTGKSTLGRALAERLGVPYLPEGMRARIEGGLDLHSLDHEGLRALVRSLWDEAREAEEAARQRAGGFIADRSSVDFAAFWLHYGFTDDSDASAAWFQETLGHAQRYDGVVLLPWGVLPLVADGVRSSNPWTQRRYQATVEGLLFREAGQKLWLMPPIQGLEDRVQWVLEAWRGSSG